ncbi:V-type ATP synthase subunit E [Haloquadratum walsbyi]|jgi:Archaeal/vacuolar-type H+-ATPase subunit E|uniref:A-type ATP synthase subunit E n=1 Tax=Haloquadratum walsbyi J07HQW2 TaxID=1238425 RepID=U1NE91_9EURY|nr:V-type ATP synthase subunit E [Haloquadratum walsbyi]ERG95325.1 MAG: archaeal/vacuolar-type H+-ATPase subunit E [Haloquadratum walsbyi J07HQW2]
MSLDTVVEDIRGEARARANEIQADADERVEKIISDAESDAEAILEKRKSEIEEQIEREREQALSSANLEAKQNRLEARRDILDDVLDHVESELASVSGTRRERLTEPLLTAAISEFDDDETVKIYARADDTNLLNSLLEEYERAEYAGEYDCLGGVVAEGQRSRVRVNNTFDSILDTVWEETLGDVSEQLFDQ